LLDAGNVHLARCRRVRQAAPLLDGQAVHVGAQQHGRAFAVAQDRDDAVTTDAFGDVIAERANFRGEALARLDFFAGELGIAVEVLEQRRQPLAVVGRDVIAQRRVRCVRFDGHGQAGDGDRDLVHDELFFLGLTTTLLQGWTASLGHALLAVTTLSRARRGTLR
jgi:hypothetical protein